MDIETKNMQVYNLIADEFSDKRYSQWDWIENFKNSFATQSMILDIGCGNGRNMEHKNLKFIGIDNCHNFIKICKEKKLHVLECDMINIPLPEATFDGIISIASFHHLSNDERRNQALMEMKRMLKDGGRILLSVWSIDQHHNSKLDFKYGDNYVPWKSNDGTIKENRYYHIFKTEDLISLLEKYFTIVSHNWDHGNEIFVLTH